MKRVNLVGKYNSEKSLACEMEDVDICSKMAYIDKPYATLWYSTLMARKVRVGWPSIVTYRTIERWKLVQNQEGEMVLFYREHRTPMLLPQIYVVRYDEEKGYFLKNISTKYRKLERLKKFYEATTRFDLNS